MLFQTFEIKVALLGYVSVGKTTVLNALLQDKFSEVSMRRTTAGVNFFRISTQSNGKDSPEKVEGKASDSTDSVGEWSMLADNPKTAESALEEITADNSELRKTNKIQEKIFDIELDGPLCEMRKDTKLTIVDVPGLNEAGTKAMYKEYVGDKWETFDCVVVVMDAEKGVNTEEQVELLHFVKDNLKNKKSVPVIVLCNKVDDPEDAELMNLVQEVREQVEKIFEVGNRSQALQQVFESSKAGNDQPPCDAYPIFIPLSAGNAFAYRTASRLSLEEFKKLDIALIDKLGRDEVGNFKWKELSLDAKYAMAYDAVSDIKQYQERLEATNFDKFLSAFSFCLGGDEVQRNLIEQQLTLSLRNLSLDSPVASQLRAIYECCKVIKKPTEQLKTSFWFMYEKLSRDAFSLFDIHMDTGGVTKALDELVGYSALATELGWTDQSDLIPMKMDELLRRQLSIIVSKANDWVPYGCRLLNISQQDHSNDIRVWEELKRNYEEYELREKKILLLKRQEKKKNVKVRRGRRPLPQSPPAEKREQDFFPRCTRYGFEEYQSSPAEYPWHWEQTEPNTWKNKHTSVTRTGEHPYLGKPSWTNLSPHDWTQVLGSLLLVSSNKHFYLRFGREKMLLERHLQAFNSYFDPLCNEIWGHSCQGWGHSCQDCGYYSGDSNGAETRVQHSSMKNFMMHFMMKGKYVNGVFTPDFPDVYKACARVEVPELLSDPKHWGNPFWKYCEFKELQ
jgi:small GTP-binding protein